MSPQDFTLTLYDVADHIATITLNRPERRNALNPRAYAEIEWAFKAASADPEVRCVIVTGTDPAFCSGEDVKEMMTGEVAAVPRTPRVKFEPTPAAMAALDCEKPVIAAVNGSAVGWGMLRSLLIAMALLAGPPALAQSVSAPPIEARFAPYAAEIAAAQDRLNAFMTAFNARDAVAYEATFNFPHVRFASGKVTIMQPGDNKPSMFTSGALKDWDHSAWERRNVIHAGPDKVHIDTRFVRYRKDGSVIGGFDSLYIVTRVNGHWGIQGRSSFAP